MPRGTLCALLLGTALLPATLGDATARDVARHAIARGDLAVSVSKEPSLPSSSSRWLSPRGCKSVLLKASQWLDGAGVTVFSNGHDEGTHAACDPTGTEQIVSGWTVNFPRGSEWSSTELVNRLYLRKHWTDQYWRGGGGDSAVGRRNSMFYDPPNSLGRLRQPEGSISYVAPGDAVFVNVYVHGHFLPGGEALVVNTAGEETSGTVPLVSQNSGTVRAADPMSAVEPTLRDGELRFTIPRGSPLRYVTIGIVHAPTTLARLSGVTQVVGSDDNFCALLAGGSVDCWGGNTWGELGQGSYGESAIPVPVVSTDGSGMLTGVTRLTSDGSGFCALLQAGTVACWGFGSAGDLGDGRYVGSTSPSLVVSTGGGGVLTGVSDLTADSGGYCALLVTNAVDCWGYAPNGQLGNGTFYTLSDHWGSAVPVHVVSTGGTGVLSSVASLSSDGTGYCARLSTGAVDCWGYDDNGELGDGSYDTTGATGSAIPVPVVGLGGSGLLGGVVSVVGEPSLVNGGYCALLLGGTVDCWGYGVAGQLGDGTFYGMTDNYGSAIPVRVVSTSGASALGGVGDLVAGHGTTCAVLEEGAVDCWGQGQYGALGNAKNYSLSGPVGSAVPVEVVTTTGAGALSGVTGVVPGIGNFCATLASGGVDCWGSARAGSLGHGVYPRDDYLSLSVAVPETVVAAYGAQPLAGVSGVASDGMGYCALLVSTGSVECWGYGQFGELGDGSFYAQDPLGSPRPVPVAADVGNGI